jgi:hypothetical protein
VVSVIFYIAPGLQYFILIKAISAFSAVDPFDDYVDYVTTLAWYGVPFFSPCLHFLT